MIIKFVMVGIGPTHPEFKVESIIAGIVNNLQEKYNIVNRSATQLIDWWGYGCEVSEAVSEYDWRKLPNVLVYGGHMLSVQVEGWHPL